MKTKIAALGLAAASFAGLGAGSMVTASSAEAGIPHLYQHTSALYATNASCVATQRGVIQRIHNGSTAFITAAGRCRYVPWPGVLHRPGGFYTYDHISYIADHAKLAGDIKRY